MTTVRLHGMLGKQFGETWQFEVQSIRQAIKLLEVNTKGLFQFLIDKDKEGVSYRLLINGKDHRCDEDLILVRKLETIDLVPVPQGALGGLFKILIGVVIIAAVIVASIFTFGTAGAAFAAIMAGSTLTASLLGAALVFGASLILGGLFELVSGSGKAKGGSSFGGDGQKNSEQPAPSYIFSGPVNTIRQGNPIPIGYGLLRVGSQVISSGITTRNTSV